MPYQGGKGGAGVYQTIINNMPCHEVYIEPFLGAGAVMVAKRPARLNIGVDLDVEAVIQARARIAGNGDTGSSLAGCDDTRSSLARYGDAAASPAGARGPHTAARHATAGVIAATGDDGRYVFRIGDGIAFLQSYPFHGNELVYCDPPYLHCTRRDTNLYRYEMTDCQHEALLAVLLSLSCPVLISGYWSTLYAEAFCAWRACSYQTMTRRGAVTEWLWCNFDTPTALHDYRYLGENFRERERIKRLTARWVKRLQAMPTLQRQALHAALAHVGGSAGLHRREER